MMPCQHDTLGRFREISVNFPGFWTHAGHMAPRIRLHYPRIPLRCLLLPLAVKFDVSSQHGVHPRLITLTLGFEPLDDFRVDPQGDISLRGPATGDDGITPHLGGDLRRVLVDDDVLIPHRLDALPVGLCLPPSLKFLEFFGRISNDLGTWHCKPSFPFVWRAGTKCPRRNRLAANAGPLPCPDASTRSPTSSSPSPYSRALNRYPMIRIPIPTTPAKVAIKRTLRTFRRMIISGRDSPITDIMNASTVPRAAPFPRRACTTGMMLAALEYMGMPITTASGTDHHAPDPMIPAMKFSGT